MKSRKVTPVKSFITLAPIVSRMRQGREKMAVKATKHRFKIFLDENTSLDGIHLLSKMFI